MPLIYTPSLLYVVNIHPTVEVYINYIQQYIQFYFFSKNNFI